MERPQEQLPLKEMLLDEKVENYSRAKLIGIQGMAGLGKSVTTCALANDVEIRRFFSDGIFWIKTGINPEITSLQEELAFSLEKEISNISDVRKGKQYLQQLFYNKTCLFILDDVWNLQHVAHFEFLETQSKMLITTRSKEILIGLRGEIYSLDVLQEDLALQLLHKASHLLPDTPLPKEAYSIVKECGYLPLALSMIGAMACRTKKPRWEWLLEKLRDTNLQKIRQDFQDYPYPDLFKALHVSIENINPILQKRYYELAVFPKGFHIPENVFSILWLEEDLGDYEDPLEVLDFWLGNSLVQQHRSGSILLHDLQHDYVSFQIDDVISLHHRIIENYAKKRSQEQNKIPDDGYYQEQILNHFSAVGERGESKKIAKELLLGAPLLSAKTGIKALKFFDNQEILEIAQELLEKRFSNPTILIFCLKLLPISQAQKWATELLKESRVPALLCFCLKLLKEKAIDFVEGLLEEKQNQEVLCTCLKILRKGKKQKAKEYATQFLKDENCHPEVLCICLNILGKETKREAGIWIQKGKHKDVLCKCIQILGKEAKQYKTQLFDKQAHHQVVSTYIRIVGESDKENTKKILKINSMHPDIHSACLKVLGKEAIDEAEIFIERSKNDQILLECIKILEEKAKPYTEILIKQERQHPTILLKCLDLLEKNKALHYAEKLLRQKHGHSQVICKSLDLLGKIAKPYAKELILKNKNKEVLCRCLKILGEEAEEFALKILLDKGTTDLYLRSLCLQATKKSNEGKKEAIQILSQWQNENRLLVNASLVALEAFPDKTFLCSEKILENWKGEIQYRISKKRKPYDEHIFQALNHPHLQEKAKISAEEMLQWKEENPHFFSKKLQKQIQIFLEKIC